AAVRTQPKSVSLTVSALAWAVWVAGLPALLRALPATLTALRVVAPAPLVAGTVAAVVEPPNLLGWTGLVTAAVVLAAALAAEVGDYYVDGASYGDERRFTLRAPAAVQVAVPFVWTLAVVPVVAGTVALAAQAWLPGGVLVALGAVTAVVGVRVLHRLSLRWLVVVPSWFTLVDALALTQPTLFAARQTTRVGPAHVGTTATDLTAGAPGLVLQIDTSPPTEVVHVVRRGATATPVPAAAVLVCPSRPGRVLAELESRGLPVARD
ncbi:MAG: hypothetical protein ACKO04_08385, partial [Actinomycetes bacterium]